jgi:chromosome segregation ATPase
MKIQLDFKSILILVFLGISILFFSMWFLKGTGYKKEFKKLELEFQKLQKTRDSLEAVNIKLKIDFEKIQQKIDERNLEIKKVEYELVKVKKDLNSSNNQLQKNKKDLEETRKKIEKLKKDPIKREGEDLINSLKEKLK